MSLFKLLLEQFADDVDLKELNKIDQDRIIYAQLKRKAHKKFRRLSGGSGRDVYDFKDNKVIKLAKNDKGLAQNEQEYSLGTEAFIDDVVANVFYGSENFSFLISEKAEPIKSAEFERVSGVKWDHFANYMHWWGNHLTGKKQHFKDEEAIKAIDDALNEDNEIVVKFTNFVANYHMGDVVGDLARKSSYGLVQRDYGEDIVLIDYGLTKEIYEKHYK